MKITAIQQQKKRPERVNIFIDGKFAFGLESKFLIDYDLYKEKEVSENEIAKIIRKDSGERLKFRILKLISTRPRSEKEIRDYILRKLKIGKIDIAEEFWSDITDGIVKDLKNLNLINDEQYAQWHVENRVRFKPRGKTILKFELRNKGIEEEVISKVFDKNLIDELYLAKKLVEKKLPSLTRFDKQKRKEKLIAFLQRKGFGWDVVKKVIEYLKL